MKKYDVPRKWKLKKGDEVVVTGGRDKGKKGQILFIDRAKGRVTVQGVRMIKRHTKPSVEVGSGGIVEKEASIHLSNVAFFDTKSGRGTKLGFRLLEDGRKVRFSKVSGEVVD